MKTYLGDSVYAESYSDGCIILTTNNGGPDKMQIMLEPEVLEVLDRFRKQVADRTKTENSGDSNA